jgi:Icc-related predicted phosphoesterase
MRILFITDLHGAGWKYERAVACARERGATLLVHGGDLLPHSSDFSAGKAFIQEHLDRHFAACADAGIECLIYPGNDDPMALDPLFEATCRRHAGIHHLAQQKIERGGFEFIGMNWVVDYPFRIKDRCRMDTPEYEFQAQFGTGLLSTPNGWRELPDWKSYARTLPTIAAELERLPKPDDFSRAIYVIHMPPAKLGLDVCGTGMEVGSVALHRFIQKYQPRLTLHGHIHESPQISGIWKATLARTVCIQPGQLRPFTAVLIDLETMEAERIEE